MPVLLIALVMALAPPGQAPGRHPAPAVFQAADLHADLLYRMWRRPSEDLHSKRPQTRLAALEQGMVALQVFPVFVPPVESRDHTATAAKQLTIFKEKVLEASGGRILQARSHADVLSITRKGGIAAILAMEGAHPLGDQPENLDAWGAAGLRVLGLTWNNSNAFADGLEAKVTRGGLTGKGRLLLKKMEQFRIIPDLSHAHPETFWDVVTTAKGPVIVSHANARAIHDHPRNLDDEQLLAIAQKQGVVGLCYHATFTTGARPPLMEHLHPHTAHMIKIGGPGLPALGSDFDGGIKPLRGLEHAGLLQGFLRELARLGLGDPGVGRLAWGNALRVLALADGDWSSLPPLDWRPMSASPTAEPRKNRVLFDRLSTTHRTFCKDQHTVQIEIPFRVRGKGLGKIALRALAPAGSVQVQAIVGAKRHKRTMRATCPGNGRRCLIPVDHRVHGEPDLPVVLRLRSRGPAGGRHICLKVLDVVPIETIRRR